MGYLYGRSWDHRSAGIWAALRMDGSLTPAFSSFFFGWLSNNSDPHSGYVCASEDTKGTPPANGLAPIGWMTCFAHLSWQFVYANGNSAFPLYKTLPCTCMWCILHGGCVCNRETVGVVSWPYPKQQVDSGLGMQNASTGYFCVSPGASNQCHQQCPPKAGTPGCGVNGCCGSASAVLPSCHQLDGIWTITRSSALADVSARITPCIASHSTPNAHGVTA